MRGFVLLVAATTLLATQGSRSQTTSVAATSAAAEAPAAGTSDAQLAQLLANPVSSLISVPFQSNCNQGFAGGVGDPNVLNVQPVIPFSISENWNVISRTIVPVVSQDGMIPGAGPQFGLGATTESLFFPPKAPAPGGLL